jgi:hypothetical protein
MHDREDPGGDRPRQPSTAALSPRVIREELLDAHPGIFTTLHPRVSPIRLIQPQLLQLWIEMDARQQPLSERDAILVRKSHRGRFDLF